MSFFGFNTSPTRIVREYNWLLSGGGLFGSYGGGLFGGGFGGGLFGGGYNYRPSRGYGYERAGYQDRPPRQPRGEFRGEPQRQAFVRGDNGELVPVDLEGAYVGEEIVEDRQRQRPHPHARQYSNHHNSNHHRQPQHSAQPQSRPFATNEDPDIQNLTDRLQDVVKAGNDPEKLKNAAQAYAQAAQVFGGKEGRLPVPPQGVLVPAHGDYKGFEVYGKDRLRGRAHNSPGYLADYALNHGGNRHAAQVVHDALVARSKESAPPAQGIGQPLELRPNAPQAPNNPQTNLQTNPQSSQPTSGAVDLNRLEAMLKEEYSHTKSPKEKEAAIKGLQSKLAMNGFGMKEHFSPIDGKIGPLTTAGFAQFAQSKELDPMNVKQVMNALQQQSRSSGITGGRDYAGEPPSNLVVSVTPTNEAVMRG